LRTVTFVTREIRRRWRDIACLREPQDVAARIRSGVDVWVISTYLELRARASSLPFGLAIADRFPPGEAVVAHRDDLRLKTAYWRSMVAGVRADRSRIYTTSCEILQSPHQACDGGAHIPSWPQPGLKPRAAQRQGVRTLGYFGRPVGLPGFYGDADFQVELHRRGVALALNHHDWRDYSATDACIALRDPRAVDVGRKPFAKLVNAWLAGVPALLGPEPAYRALRRTELDYLEVASARDILAALDVLRCDPGRYRAMVENGRRRSEAFTRDKIAEKWIVFLTGFVAALDAWRPMPQRALLGRLALQWLAKRRAPTSRALPSPARP
jgi:hypothetical protein